MELDDIPLRCREQSQRFSDLDQRCIERRSRSGRLSERLRAYVQDRLVGTIADARGKPIPGPQVPWKKRRHGRRADRRWSKCWSPQQSSRRLQIDFPQDASMRISHEAIYRALNVQGRGALRRELSTCLRTGRVLRVPRARTQFLARRPNRPAGPNLSRTGGPRTRRPDPIQRARHVAAELLPNRAPTPRPIPFGLLVLNVRPHRHGGRGAETCHLLPKGDNRQAMDGSSPGRSATPGPGNGGRRRPACTPAFRTPLNSPQPPLSSNPGT